MPTFTKQVRISTLDGTRAVEVLAVVDTGASFTHVPAEIASQLQLVSRSSRQFRLANGQVVEYQIANALVELVDQGEPVATSVAIGEAGAPVLLGALALDAFGLGVDTEGRRLIPKVSDLLLETLWPTT